MRRPRKRALHYSASSLHDGTVMAACPMRKPAPRIMKRDGMRTDADGVTQEFTRSGQELSDWNYEGRLRFQDIIANRLNTRRALRELVVVPLTEIHAEIAALREEVASLRQALAEHRIAGPGKPG